MLAFLECSRKLTLKARSRRVSRKANSGERRAGIDTQVSCNHHNSHLHRNKV